MPVPALRPVRDLLLLANGQILAARSALAQAEATLPATVHVDLVGLLGDADRALRDLATALSSHVQATEPPTSDLVEDLRDPHRKCADFLAEDADYVCAADCPAFAPEARAARAQERADEATSG